MHLLYTLVATTLPLAAVASPQLMSRQTATKITVDPTKHFQTMDGFEKHSWISYSTEPPARFSILRNGLGSSPDSSSDHMNTILPKSPGSATATPNYVWDGKDSGQFWLSQQAAAYGVKYFYSNAWSAPGFMKSNGNDANGGSLSDAWKPAFAAYLIQYMKYYTDAGVPISHVGFLNEPDFTASYASMLSDGAQAASFIKVLRPALDAANMSNIGIVCCESTGWSKAQGMVSGIKSAGADSMLAVVSSHEYTSRASGSLSSTHHTWQSEYADLNGAWTTAWYSSGGAGEGMTWANNIYSAITGANVSGYIGWVATQGGSTNEKMIQTDANGYTVSKRLWAFAQYSRTVRPNAIRLGTTGGSFKTTAFKNEDGSIAVNIINTGSSAASVSIAVTGFTVTAATAWLTDTKNDMTAQTVTVADGGVEGSIPARAMVSFVLTGT